MNQSLFRQQTESKLQSVLIAMACLALLIQANSVAAQSPIDDRQLLNLVEKVARDQSDKNALRQVVRNMSRYRDLVAEGRVPKASVEVLDNQIWDTAMRAWNEVQRKNPELVRVDLVGSGGRRGEVGNSYIFGKSDLDFIPHATTPEAAEAAAAEFRQQLIREWGVNPQQIGVNALTPVTADERSLAVALADPEKYPLRERTMILEFQNYQNGMTLVWENGEVRRLPLREVYAQNGWTPPPAPTPLEAFGAAVSEGKFLDPRNGLVGVEKAIHDAKYHVRTLNHAVDIAGVELPPGTEELRKELQGIVGSKSVNSALSERIARNGGNVEVAIAEHLAEADKLQKQVTRNLLRNHFELLRDKVAQGGEALTEAKESFRKVKQALAVMKDADARQMLKGLGISAENVETIANEASARRIMMAREADRAAQETRNLAEALIRKLPASEQAAARAQLTGIARLPEGKTLIAKITETLRARPVASGLIVLTAVHEIQRVATIAGEKGPQEGALAAVNAAADWRLMAVSPHYAVVRLLIDLEKLGVDFAIVGPIKEKVIESAYSGENGFLAHFGLSRGELTRLYSSEEDALKASRKWYGQWMTVHGEYLGKTEIEAAFYRQVRADFEVSRRLQAARDYSFDPKTNKYGEKGFFRRNDDGPLTFEDFAVRYPTENEAAIAIRKYIDLTYLLDFEKYNFKPGDRNAQEDLLRNYLLQLWKASARHRDELKQARLDAERRLKEELEGESGDELDLVQFLRPSTDSTAVVLDRIRKARSNWDALHHALALLKRLNQMARASRDAEAEFQKMADAVEADAQSLAILRQQLTDDTVFLEKTATRADLLRTGIKGGILQASNIVDLMDTFRTVQSQAEDISTTVDTGIANFKSGRIGLTALRELYYQLLQRYNDATSRFKPASEKYAMLLALGTLNLTTDECIWARLRITEGIRQAETSAADARSTTVDLGNRLDQLTSAERDFAILKPQLDSILGELLSQALDQGESTVASELRQQLSKCELVPAPQSKARSVKAMSERNSDEWQALADTKCPALPELGDLVKYVDPVRQVLQDLSPAAIAANEALKTAERKLRDLAAFLESKPTEVKPPPVAPPNTIATTTPRPTPNSGGGTATVREPSTNNFVVEMEGMPSNATFVWNFGDGTETSTVTPQVQHQYQAPTSGLAGLAGRRWQLTVTIKQGNRVVATATCPVSRGRLTTTPIGPPRHSLPTGIKLPR
ncbi:MAG: PKD domain-containing protein [Planctomycetes bacterium]|nr:PKD domain-containing protein [Planctomycetota bacterium]